MSTSRPTTTTRKPGDVTYSAIVAAEEGQVEVIVRRAVYAGIDAPFDGFTLESGANMREVSAELERRGYAPVAIDEWSAEVGFDGIRLYATLSVVA